VNKGSIKKLLFTLFALFFWVTKQVNASDHQAGQVYFSASFPPWCLITAVPFENLWCSLDADLMLIKPNDTLFKIKAVYPFSFEASYGEDATKSTRSALIFSGMYGSKWGLPLGNSSFTFAGGPFVGKENDKHEITDVETKSISGRQVGMGLDATFCFGISEDADLTISHSQYHVLYRSNEEFDQRFYGTIPTFGVKILLGFTL